MLFWPLAFTAPNALRAAGDVRVPMVTPISITSMLVVRGAAICWASTWPGRHRRVAGHGGDWVVRLICFVLRAPEKAVAGTPLKTRAPKPFGCAFSLPEVQRVLHAQAHRRDGRPAAQAHQEWSAAGPDELIRSVLSPMAAMAMMMMKNLDGLKRSKGRCVHSCQDDAPIMKVIRRPA